MPRRDPDNLTDRKCLVPTCPKRELAKGLCTKHYSRWRLHGNVRNTNKPWYRFWTQLSPTDSEGCWEWQGVRSTVGYGRFDPGDGRGQQQAHRIAWELFVGPIPESLEIDHLCRNKPCVNPRHLEPVTREENMRRAKGWVHPNHRNIRVTHCPYGHPYDEENTYFNGKGDRICRACNRRRSLQNYYAKRAAAVNG